MMVPVSGDGGRQIGAVLLAAGESTRFGDQNKLLAEIDGVPVVRRATESLCEGTDGRVTVICGYEATAVRNCLTDLPVDFRINDAYDTGQSSSVREGVLAARERGWEGTIFALGDMPYVSPVSVRTLIEAYRNGAGSIVAAGYDGTRGNPVLFDRKHYNTLIDLNGDVGGRKLVTRHPESVIVETDDPGVFRDIDRSDDLPGDKR